ncbi:uncharacterized protein LOC122393607 [Amphibalanus amphitrite]|uniref:uncharacterized protein LOC122393607 n=1 Tax=Amphibalanus amphitrite TaxID=1232801 RepID=UPI001C927F78|nr:uncharacterized protein LOC122393607 [Amphibalanus amphitrite]
MKLAFGAMLAGDSTPKHPDRTPRRSLSPTKARGVVFREHAEVKVPEPHSPREVGAMSRTRGPAAKSGDNLVVKVGSPGVTSGKRVPMKERVIVGEHHVVADQILLPDQQYEEAGSAPSSSQATSLPPSSSPSGDTHATSSAARKPAPEKVSGEAGSGATRQPSPERRRVSSQERHVRRQMRHMLWCRELLRTFRARPEFFCQFRGGVGGGGTPCWLSFQSHEDPAPTTRKRRQSAEEPAPPSPPPAAAPVTARGQLRMVRSRSTPDLRRLSTGRRSGDSAFSELGAESDSPQASNDSGNPETVSSVLQRTVSLRRKMRGKTRDEGMKTGWLYRGQRGPLYDTVPRPSSADQTQVLPRRGRRRNYGVTKLPPEDRAVEDCVSRFAERYGPVSVNGTMPHPPVDSIWVGPPRKSWHGDDSYSPHEDSLDRGDTYDNAFYDGDGSVIYNPSYTETLPKPGAAIYADSGATTQVYVNGVHVLCMNNEPYNERNIDEEIAARSRDAPDEPPYAQPRKLAQRDLCNNWIGRESSPRRRSHSPEPEPVLGPEPEPGYCVMVPVRTPCPAYRPPPEVTVSSHRPVTSSNCSPASSDLPPLTSQSPPMTSHTQLASLPHEPSNTPADSYACLRRSYTNFYTEDELRGLVDSSDRDTIPRGGDSRRDSGGSGDSNDSGGGQRRKPGVASGRWAARLREGSYARRKARTRSVDRAVGTDRSSEECPEEAGLRRRRRSGSAEPCQCSACSEEHSSLSEPRLVEDPDERVQ